MLVFIDDSGDAGFKFGQGSSDHLVIACCVFRTAEAAEKTAAEIRQFRKNLGWHPDEEFKFSKTHESIRLEFMAFASRFDFILRSVVFAKEDFDPQVLEAGESLSLFAIREALLGSLDVLQKASVKIDGQNSKDYRNSAQKYLRAGSSNQILKVKFIDSRSDQLIQLADMVAGAVRKSYDPKHQKNSVYREGLKSIGSMPDSRIWIFGSELK